MAIYRLSFGAIGGAQSQEFRLPASQAAQLAASLVAVFDSPDALSANPANWWICQPSTRQRMTREEWMGLTHYVTIHRDAQS